MRMFIIVLFAALAGCDNYTEEVCTRSKIAQVLDCTGEQSTVSGGGIAYKGTGIADVSTNVINGKCRVEFDNGMRHTLDRPLAVGDVHVFTQDVEMIRKDGVITTHDYDNLKYFTNIEGVYGCRVWRDPKPTGSMQ